MSPQVDAIWQEIQRLDEADRLVLEERLQEISECQWRAEAEHVRTEAHERRIDQRAIDDAVDELRYGS